MDKNLKITTCPSYSDLFEDFFHADAVITTDQSCGKTNTAEVDSLFLGSKSSQVQMVQISDFAQLSTDQSTMDFYMQQQFPAFYQGPAPPHSFDPSSATSLSSASVQKPGFIRNRTRKNMRQKSVNSAVRASHMINSTLQGPVPVNVPVNANMFNQQQPHYNQQQPQYNTQQPQYSQQQTHHNQQQLYPDQHQQHQFQYFQEQQHQYMQGQQIPYYQAAAQLPSYQQQQHVAHAVLLAKSPATQQPFTPFIRTSLPASPSSTRSPNSNSSDYVKMKLQQKIRSRMVSKGQVPPNPTEEELRMCGINQLPQQPLQSSQQQIVTVSQLPTPKASPHQIPRAFNNNAAAFIAAPVPFSSDQLQQTTPLFSEDMMKYFDVTGGATDYSEKDPLAIISNGAVDYNFSKQQQQQHQQQKKQQQQLQEPNVTVNYDQFFSDFILY